MFIFFVGTKSHSHKRLTIYRNNLVVALRPETKYGTLLDNSISIDYPYSLEIKNEIKKNNNFIYASNILNREGLAEFRFSGAQRASLLKAERIAAEW